MEVVVTTADIRLANIQPNITKFTNIQFFYRPDATNSVKALKVLIVP